MIAVEGRIDDSLRVKKAKIDLKDKKILCYLSEDARIPFTQLRKSVQLSRDAVDYRVKRMQEKGVIKKFFPIIDLKRFGFFTFHTFLLLDERDKERVREFVQYLTMLPFIKNIIEYSDVWDMEIVIVAKNVHDYDRKLNDITSKYHDIILEKEKLKVIKGYNSIHLPNVFYGEAQHSLGKERKSIDVDLDETDLKILSMMCEDGRIAYHDMAVKLGMTGEAVSYRVRKMVNANVIRKFSAIINLSALGYHWFTFLMQTKTFNNQLDSKMKQFVLAHPHIIRAVKTLGRWDFMFYVVADTPKQFHEASKDVKHEFSQVIRKHDTLLGYKEYYYNPLPDYVLSK